MTTVNGSNYTPYNSNSAEVSNNSQTLMKDDFLKLFIAQLKNQDPLSPVDDSQFLAQLAQFSSLEQMSNVAKSVEDLNQNMTMLTSQSLLVQGAAMIGKEAVGIDGDGQEVSGLISSVKWNGASLQVAIGDKMINLENIIEVREAGAAAITAQEAEEPDTNDGAGLAGTTENETQDSATNDSIESP